MEEAKFGLSTPEGVQGKGGILLTVSLSLPCTLKGASSWSLRLHV